MQSIVCANQKLLTLHSFNSLIESCQYLFFGISNIPTYFEVEIELNKKVLYGYKLYASQFLNQ